MVVNLLGGEIEELGQLWTRTRLSQWFDDIQTDRPEQGSRNSWLLE